MADSTTQNDALIEEETQEEQTEESIEGNIMVNTLKFIHLKLMLMIYNRLKYIIIIIN